MSCFCLFCCSMEIFLTIEVIGQSASLRNTKCSQTLASEPLHPSPFVFCSYLSYSVSSTVILHPLLCIPLCFSLICLPKLFFTLFYSILLTLVQHCVAVYSLSSVLAPIILNFLPQLSSYWLFSYFFFLFTTSPCPNSSSSLPPLLFLTPLPSPTSPLLLLSALLIHYASWCLSH